MHVAGRQPNGQFQADLAAAGVLDAIAHDMIGGPVGGELRMDLAVPDPGRPVSRGLRDDGRFGRGRGGGLWFAALQGKPQSGRAGVVAKQQVTGRFREEVEFGGRQLLGFRPPQAVSRREVQFIGPPGPQVDPALALRQAAETQRHEVVNVQISAGKCVESPGPDDQSQRPSGGQRPGQADRQRLPATVALQRPVVQSIRRLRFDRVDRPVGQHLGLEENTGPAPLRKSIATRLFILPWPKRVAVALTACTSVGRCERVTSIPASVAKVSKSSCSPADVVEDFASKASPAAALETDAPVCRHPRVSRRSMHSGDRTERRIVLDWQTMPVKSIRGSFQDGAVASGATARSRNFAAPSCSDGGSPIVTCRVLSP